ncbi:MAG: hypothetical protein HPY50_05750 [Firmicutes bacterium]|nr:hypothetical protein [Bacillota bacterium]
MSRISNILIVIPTALIIFAVLIFLQVFLSKRNNKWLGLMLPIICFCVALAGSGYQVYEWSTSADGGAFGWISSSSSLTTYRLSFYL